MLFEHDELEARALLAYFRRFSAGAAQPNRTLTEVAAVSDGMRIVLANINGPLATYRVRDRGQTFTLEFVNKSGLSPAA